MLEDLEKEMYRVKVVVGSALNENDIKKIIDIVFE